MEFYIGGVKVEGDPNGLKILDCGRCLTFSDMEYSEAATTWLTVEEKEMLMEGLECDEQNGELDAGSILPLRRLNALPGVASTFSCMGHNDQASLGGYLALRVSYEVAEMLDTGGIRTMWGAGLIYNAKKEWQSAYDAAGLPIPRVTYILRFHVGFLEKVCEAIYQLIKEP